MDFFSILAQTDAVAQDVQVVPIDAIWQQIVSLSWIEAVLAVSFGVVYLLYGWRIFRILVVICFALIGMYLGIRVGGMAGSKIWGGVIGLILFAVVSAPLMKWCVCLLGAGAGGILTGGLWYAFGLPEMYLWAGSAVGLVAGGMISFIVLKVAVMLFTSLGGSMIMVVGMLGLLHQYENTTTPATDLIYRMVHNTDWFLPVVFIVPTIVGIVAQNKFIKHADKWDF